MDLDTPPASPSRRLSGDSIRTRDASHASTVKAGLGEQWVEGDDGNLRMQDGSGSSTSFIVHQGPLASASQIPFSSPGLGLLQEREGDDDSPWDSGSRSTLTACTRVISGDGTIVFGQGQHRGSPSSDFAEDTLVSHNRSIRTDPQPAHTFPNGPIAKQKDNWVRVPQSPQSRTYSTTIETPFLYSSHGSQNLVKDRPIPLVLHDSDDDQDGGRQRSIGPIDDHRLACIVQSPGTLLFDGINGNDDPDQSLDVREQSTDEGSLTVHQVRQAPESSRRLSPRLSPRKLSPSPSIYGARRYHSSQVDSPPPFHHSHSTPLSLETTSNASVRIRLPSRSSRHSRVRPIAIHHPYSAEGVQRSATGTPFASRQSPYNIPLPLSSSSQSLRSAKSALLWHMGSPPPLFTHKALRTPPLYPPSHPSHPPAHSASTPTRAVKIEPGQEDELPTTPPGHPSSARPQNASPSRPIASPNGSMSLSMASASTPSKRRQPPTFPCSPRRGSITSHREIIARSAGLSSSSSASLPFSHTPNALKVPPTAQWSPAFHRSGYNRANHSYTTPYFIPVSPSYASTHHQLQPPLSAGPSYHRRPSPNSAPLASSPRVPEQPKPPSPAQVVESNKGTCQYKGVPVAWVVSELNRAAGRFWYSPSSANCRVIVPVSPTRRSRPSRQAGEDAQPDSGISVHSNQPGRSYWPPTPVCPVLPPQEYSSGIGRGQEDVISGYQVQRGRRGSLPEVDQVPVSLTCGRSLSSTYTQHMSTRCRSRSYSYPGHGVFPASRLSHHPVKALSTAIVFHSRTSRYAFARIWTGSRRHDERSENDAYSAGRYPFHLPPST